jgi:hypothetical protein
MGKSAGKSLLKKKHEAHASGEDAKANKSHGHSGWRLFGSGSKKQHASKTAPATPMLSPDTVRGQSVSLNPDGM